MTTATPAASKEKRLCDVCQMDKEECPDCDHKFGRRESDKCSSHISMVEEQEKNHTFRIKVKAGVTVGAFFLLAFAAGISQSNYVSSKNLKDGQIRFEEKTEIKQKEHEQDVSNTLVSMKRLQDDMLKTVQRIESSVEVLVELSENQRQRNKEDHQAMKSDIQRLKDTTIRRDLRDSGEYYMRGVNGNK